MSLTKKLPEVWVKKNSGSDLQDVIEAYAFERTIKLPKGLYTLPSGNSFAHSLTGRELKIVGSGCFDTKIIGSVGVADVPMLEIANTGWGSLSTQGTRCLLKDLTFEGTGVEDGILNLPYVYPKLRNVHIRGTIKANAKGVFIGGSASGGWKSYIDGLDIFLNQNNVNCDIETWLDNLWVSMLRISVWQNRTRSWYAQGEYYSIGQVGWYVSPDVTVSTALLQLAGCWLDIGHLVGNDGGANVKTMLTDANSNIQIGILSIPDNWVACANDVTRQNVEWRWKGGATLHQRGVIDTLPTPSAGYLGKVIQVLGGAGVADKYCVCVKKADDSFGWFNLITDAFE